MSETLEQRALRIAREVFKRDTGSTTSAEQLEFARRLLAEQGEPIATLHDDGCFTWKRPNERPYQADYVGWRMDVYAVPPQDALDAARYRWLRDSATFENCHNMIRMWDTEKDFDAAIDAAMQEPPK